MKKEISGRMNKKEFREITELLEENYNKKIDIRILELWYQEFKQYSKKTYQSIVIDVIRSEKFMPSLATIREYIKPEWFDEKIEKKKPSEENKMKMEEILREYK